MYYSPANVESELYGQDIIIEERHTFGDLNTDCIQTKQLYMVSPPEVESGLHG